MRRCRFAQPLDDLHLLSDQPPRSRRLREQHRPRQQIPETLCSCWRRPPNRPASDNENHHSSSGSNQAPNTAGGSDQAPITADTGNNGIITVNQGFSAERNDVENSTAIQQNGAHPITNEIRIEAQVEKSEIMNETNVTLVDMNTTTTTGKLNYHSLKIISLF